MSNTTDFDYRSERRAIILTAIDIANDDNDTANLWGITYEMVAAILSEKLGLTGEELDRECEKACKLLKIEG